MVEKCLNRIVEASKGSLTPARAKELLIDFVQQQEALKDSGDQLFLSDLSKNDAYKKWLEKTLQQERFNKYNDLLKRNDLYNAIDVNSPQSAKDSIDGLFDNIDAQIEETREFRANAFNSDLNESDVLDIYYNRQFDQKKTSIYVSRLTTKNAEAKPTLKTIPVDDINEFKIAEAMVKHNDADHAMKTNLGVPLGYLEGRINKTSHNAHTLSVPSEAQAWKEWALTEGNVDWNEMYLAGQTKEEYLDEMLLNIRSGTHSDDGINIFEVAEDGATHKSRLKESLAVSLGKQRKFMINPEQWYEYNRRFGDGDLVTSFNNNLVRGARQEALLTRFGSSPEANMKSVIQQLVNDTKHFGSEGSHPIGKQMEKRFEYISGKLDLEANGTLGRVMRTGRSFLIADKLGGALLSSLSDLSIPGWRKSVMLDEHNVLANMRIGFGSLVDNFKKIGEVFDNDVAKSIYSGKLAEMKSMSLMVRKETRFHDEFGIDIGGKPNRTVLDKLGNLSDSFNKKVSLTNLLEVWTNRRSASQYDAIAAEMGYFANKPFNEINEFTRNEYKKMGLEDVWDLLRSKAVTAEDGQVYITPTALDNLTDAELEAFDSLAKTSRGKENLRRELKLKMRTAFAQEAHNRVIEPTASSSAKSLFQLKPGTPLGELGMALGTFKSFPIAFWQKLIEPSLKHNKSAFVAGLTFQVPTLMLGLAIKDIVRGDSPRPFFNLDGETEVSTIWRNWASLLVAAGGFPVFDRQLAQVAGGEKIDKGRALADLAGPLAGYTFDQVNNVQNIIQGLFGEDEEKVKKGAAKLVLNAPFISPLLHGSILGSTIRNVVDNSILEAVSPGYIDNIENMAETQGKTHYQLPNEGEAFIENLTEKGIIR